MTIITGPAEIETDKPAPTDPLFRRIASELAAPPVDRVAELKRELADELSKRIQQVETDLAYVDAEIDTMTERRKEPSTSHSPSPTSHQDRWHRCPPPVRAGVFGGLTHLERIELRRQLEGAA